MKTSEFCNIQEIAPRAVEKIAFKVRGWRLRHPSFASVNERRAVRAREVSR